MTIAELIDRLNSLNANMNHVAICEGEKDDNLCLVCEDGGWCVFFFERGERGRVDTYATEHAACEGFLAAAMNDRAIVASNHAVP